MNEGQSPPELIPGPGYVSFYEKLGVGRTASPEEIKKGYRNKAQYYHPDKHPPAEKETWEDGFKELEEIKDTLTDPHRKELYDSRLPKLEASFYHRQQEAEKPIPKYRMEPGADIPCVVPTGEILFGRVGQLQKDPRGTVLRVETFLDDERFPRLNQRGYIANTLCYIFEYLRVHPIVEGSLEDYPSPQVEKVIKQYVKTGDPEFFVAIPRTDNLRKCARVIRTYIDEKQGIHRG